MEEHPGTKRMLKSLQRDFDWPGMENEVKEYMKGCMECQRNKADQWKKHAPLQPLAITSRPWERISIDLIGPLPMSNGSDMIMVIVDYFTKMKIFIPTTQKITSLLRQTSLRNMHSNDLEFPKELYQIKEPNLFPNS